MGATWRARRAGAAALAFAVVVGAASAEPPGAPAMAGQKARMLEAVLGSARLRAAAGADAGAAELVEQARGLLDEGRAALEAGRAGEAASLFDEGLSTASRAASSAPDRRSEDPDAARARIAARLDATGSMLAALDGIDDLAPVHRRTAAGLRARLAALRGAPDADGAAAELSAVYAEAVELVGEVRKGRVLFVSRTFDTAGEALAYERDRYESHRFLVELALARRGGFQPGLAQIAANLGAEGERLRREADEAAARGREGEAVGLMQRATDRLLTVLRASGLILSQ